MTTNIQTRTQFPADLVTFTDKILNGKLHFCAVTEQSNDNTLIMCKMLIWISRYYNHYDICVLK